MRRRYYKRTGKRDKYSIEVTNFRTGELNNWASISGDGSVTVDSKQTNFTIVPEADFEGMRKVKHLTISIANITGNGPLYYVLTYVPQGTDVLPIRTPLPGTSCNMYLANQFVLSYHLNLNCGITYYIFWQVTHRNPLFHMLVQID